MGKILFFWVLILVLIIFSGCGEGRVPEWFKFGRPKKVEEKPLEEEIEGTVLASINGRVITLEEFNDLIEAYNSEIQASRDIPESVKPTYLIKTEEDKKRRLERMIERELLIAEAIERGLDKEKDLVQAVKTLKEQLLLAKIIEVEKARIDVPAREVEEFYELYKEAFKIPEERRVSMIVVPTESRAKEILIQLLQGANFAVLAGQHSTDENSKKRGGDIGFIVRKTAFPQPEKKTMFKKFEEVAFSLELNKPSTIFRGPGGFYIIKVTEIKEARQKLLSEVYDDIREGLMLKKQEEALQTLIGNLRKGANIIIHDELLKE